MELKLDRNYDTVYQSRQRLISAIVHIMNDDARRMFMFGITIEGRRMTLWYFSRSHSMKAKSFDFTTDFPTFVNVLISLMFAEDKDLGFDPNIALASHTSRQFIYTMKSESGLRRFKTTHSIFEHRTLSVAGRMTRVFRVIDLEGQTDEPKKGAKPMVLKDVWLDEGSKTEMEIQKDLFSDIEKFAKDREWREVPSLAAFKAKAEAFTETMGAFAEYLQGGRYKDLFLVIRDGSTGEASKPLPPSALPSHSKLFYSMTFVPDPSASFATTQRLTGPPTNAGRDRQRRRESHDEGIHRHYASKRRSFLAFDDECTPVYCLPKTRDVFAVLRDCIIALRLMFCAGWVHRDISCNNIMAIKDPQTGQWKLKLADFEYSKKYDVEAVASDPPIGTAPFMPCEILQRRYFGHDGDLGSFDPFLLDIAPIAASPPPRIPVLHNYLHDLEATYWTGLWIITSRVSHGPSLSWGLKVFRNTLTLLPDRLDAFVESVRPVLEECLVEDLRGIAKKFERVRKVLYACAQSLGEKKAWKTEEGLLAYSAAHAHLTAMFGTLANSAAAWGNVDLESSTSSSPRCLESVVKGEPSVVSSTGQGSKEGAALLSVSQDAKRDTKDKKKEKLARRVKPEYPEKKAGPALRQKRTHRDDEEANEDGRSGNSKRVKSNGGRGAPASSAPSGNSTTAGRTRYPRKAKAQPQD
ncbi:hypothetical protein MD484_g1307, partial [Candolleomyces efflorescens]